MTHRRSSLVHGAIGLLAAATIGVASGPPAVAADPSDLRPVATLELVQATHERVTLEGLTTERGTFRTRDGGRLEVPTAKIVAWGRCPPWPVGPHVVLTDGGVIAGRVESFDGTTAVVETAAFGRLALSAGAFAGYRRTAASQPVAAALDQERTAEADPAARFFLLLQNGDRLAARSLAINAGLAQIDWQGGRVAVPMERVQSLTVLPADEKTALPSAALRVALDDGSRFAVTGISPSKPGLPCDADLVVAVEGPAAMSLAAMTPSVFETPPAKAAECPLARGQTLAGDWPAARGRTGFTGLGIRAPCRMRYRLDRPSDRFESTVAIDDSAGQGGSVVVRVMAIGQDGEPREVFASPVLRGGGEPLAIRVNLAGAREITLAVESAGSGENLDRTIWLDPRAVAVE